MSVYKKCLSLLAGRFSQEARILFLLLAVFIPVYATTIFGMDTDFQGYIFDTVSLLHGRIPYAEFFDNKPPGLWLLLAAGQPLASIPVWLEAQYPALLNTIVANPMLPYFLVHLVIVFACNALMFAIVRRLHGGTTGFWGGLIAVLVFQVPTIGMSCGYGMLNGSIVFASVLFTLVTLMFCIRLREALDRGETRAAHRLAVLVGFSAGMAFIIRFSPVPALLIAATVLAYAWRTGWRRANGYTVAVSAAAGMIVPCLVALALARFDVGLVREKLFFWNAMYLAHRGNLLHGLLSAGRDVLFYGAVPCVLLSALLFRRFHETGKREFGPQLRNLISNPDHALLLLYVVLELGAMVLSRTNGKQYMSYSFMAAMSLSIGFLAAQERSRRGFDARPLGYVAAGLVATVLLLVGVSLVYYKHQNAVVLRWPDQALAEKIRSYAPGPTDYYALDYRSYLYVALGKFPPVAIPYFDQDAWSYFGARPNEYARTWKLLEAASPRAVTLNTDSLLTGNVDRKRFLRNYCIEWAYQTIYRGDAVLVVRRDTFAGPCRIPTITNVKHVPETPNLISIEGFRWLTH